MLQVSEASTCKESDVSHESRTAVSCIVQSSAHTHHACEGDTELCQDHASGSVLGSHFRSNCQRSAC